MDAAATIDATPSSGAPHSVSHGSTTRLGSRIGSGSSSASGASGRFPAGTVFAGRYRMIGALGRGGMGEVYLADDLTLGQPVALKFLPDTLANDPARRDRFHAEVRIARQISHPNVCRVYDIGASDGIHYLSMEYVDGEDLTSLLRRIGRFPQDKAVDIARQICAGLAAAHDKGVVHRDLKPANIMLDGDGKVRITDFGLAEMAHTVSGSDARAGTPAYMAPEQLLGETVTNKSDLYALGLLLYEIFTGKQAFDAKTLGELTQLRASGSVASPSTIVGGIDPAVERVILQCLERDPEERPISALAVSAALPGGDPLAAALAAGETPSPELLAALGARSSVSAPHAWIMAGVAAVLFVLFAAANGPMRAPVMDGFEKPGPVLIETATQILRDAGYDEEPADRASGFTVDGARRTAILGADSIRDWADIAATRPALHRFWYRDGATHMGPDNPDGEVRFQDPPFTRTGMRRVLLSASGELIRLDVVPDQVIPDSATVRQPNWPALFERAGLSMEAFEETAPEWAPRVYCDEVRAWRGHYPGARRDSVRIEAGAFQGRPVYFEVVAPWTWADTPGDDLTPGSARLGQLISLVLIASALFGGLFVARRNLKLGRGDRRGAFQMFVFVVLLLLTDWLLNANHPSSAVASFNGFIFALGPTLFFGAFLWIMYIALEPHVRRTHPRLLVSWSRVTTGRWRDSVVGRDVLIGILTALGIVLLDVAHCILPPRIGLVGSALPLFFTTTFLVGQNRLVGALAATIASAVLNGLFIMFVPTLIEALIRKRVIALVLFTLVLGVLFGSRAGSDPRIGFLFGALQAALFIYVMARFGLLAVTMTAIFYFLLVSMPISMDFSSWYASGNLVVFVFFGAALAGGLRIALGTGPGLRHTS